MKFYFDPNERISGAFWNFLTVNYYPFMKYPSLLKLAWCIHFYFLSLLIFLGTFYAVARYFVSRRLAILGGFALISTWSFTKILAYNFGSLVLTTYSVLWVWSTLWCTKSSTYRSGLFVGLVGAWGVVLDKTNLFLFIGQLIVLYSIFLNDKTNWYKRQFFKYCSFGIVLSLLAFILSTSVVDFSITPNLNILYDAGKFLERKSFFVMSIFGLVIFLFKLVSQKNDLYNMGTIQIEKINQLASSLFFIIIISLAFEARVAKEFSLIWMIALFSILPIEVIFQRIRGLRSRRNVIYMVYILICLLDSHFEGRLKIIYRMFFS